MSKPQGLFIENKLGKSRVNLRIGVTMSYWKMKNVSSVRNGERAIS